MRPSRLRMSLRATAPLLVAALSVLTLAVFGEATAFAQDISTDHSASGSSPAPRARRGFQMAISTGYAVPFGKLSGASGDDLSKSFGGRVPILFDLGGKVSNHVYVGGYLGLAFGGAGSSFDQVCGAAGTSCVQVGYRFGAAVQYHFAPAETVNPWIGYGIGYEVSAFAVGTGNSSSNVSATGAGGPEFARLMAGADFRLSRGFGIGPYVDFGVGEYTANAAKIGNQETVTSTIRDNALHEWLTFGARFVIFP